VECRRLRSVRTGVKRIGVAVALLLQGERFVQWHDSDVREICV